MLTRLSKKRKRQEVKEQLQVAVMEKDHKRIKEFVKENSEKQDDNPEKLLSSQLQELAVTAGEQSDAVAALTFCEDDITAAARSVFDGNQAGLSSDRILTLLRFSPHTVVDKLVEEKLKDNNADSDTKKFLRSKYPVLKRSFYSLAPYFSRYSKPWELASVGRSYHNSIYESLTVGCKKDLQYGKDRQALAKILLKKLNDPTKNFSPGSGSAFAKLPASLKNTRRAAALLEKISAWTYANQKHEDFRTLRTCCEWQTPMSDRYAWGELLARTVLYNSEATDFKNNGNSYSLYYEGYCLNRVSMSCWQHGQQPISRTWPSLEDLFEKIWLMQLKKPANQATAEDDKVYQGQFTEFYSCVAELLWLIGNTQPMNRGSGTFAEIMLALVHLRHGLQPPILKLDFPQLDVLDITFPLSDYKRFFPYFFEPASIPKHLRLPDSTLSSLSPAEQITWLYSIFNGPLTVKKRIQTQPDKSLSTSEAEHPRKYSRIGL